MLQHARSFSYCIAGLDLFSLISPLICHCVVVLPIPVLPDSPNFPYRRYERLPPIHQFSIESDSDLSETAELIEEYEVFDPSRARPKVILVIGKCATISIYLSLSLSLSSLQTHTHTLTHAGITGRFGLM